MRSGLMQDLANEASTFIYIIVMSTLKNRFCASSSFALEGDASAHMDRCRKSPAHGASCGFVAFAESESRELRLAGRERTAERYDTVINSFRRFLSARGDIGLGLVDSSLMVAYESYLKDSGICFNSISFYMRGLRAIYNRAVDKGAVDQRNPFRHVYTGISKTVKRAVPVEVIREIRDMDLSSDLSSDFARDIFMFSFYTRGMSFVDMAFLKKCDLKNGVLSYCRQKTGQRLFIRWERPMQEIVDKYDTSEIPYLLPIIRDNYKDARRQYMSAEHLVNSKLKRIGRILGLEKPLTTYVARHGWASIARSRNISIATISEALGHDSEKTTRIYLASLDTSLVDNANRLVLELL